MADPLSDLTERALDAAAKAGAEAADVIATDGVSLQISVRDGALEKAERSEGVEIGLRVLIGQRQATVSASRTDDGTLAEMAERAVAMAKEAPEDPYVGLAAADQLATSWDVDALELADPADEPAPDALEDDARRAEAAARAIDGITKVDEAAAAYSQRRTRLAASNGFGGEGVRTDRATYCVAISGEGTGMERDYASEVRTFQADLPSPESIGTLAGERTIQRIGARKPPTGAFPVLYDERVASSLIGHLLSAANGTAVARGASWLRDAMGEQVLPSALSVIEDPHRPRISGSRMFDAEGLPTVRRAIVDGGVLKAWTLDLATARKLGLESTANAGRPVSGAPTPRNYNIALTQGSASRDDLLREMGTGLLITSMIGASINATTGDYSRGASGFWVENGEIAYPVNECTVAGNLRDMLKTLVPANDARTHLSRVVPSCLVDGLTIAGA